MRTQEHPDHAYARYEAQDEEELERSWRHELEERHAPARTPCGGRCSPAGCHSPRCFIAEQDAA